MLPFVFSYKVRFMIMADDTPIKTYKVLSTKAEQFCLTCQKEIHATKYRVRLLDHYDYVTDNGKSIWEIDWCQDHFTRLSKCLSKTAGGESPESNKNEWVSDRKRKTKDIHRNQSQTLHKIHLRHILRGNTYIKDNGGV